MGPCSSRISTMLLAGIAFAAMVVLPLTSVRTARGQGTPGTVNVDSILAAVQDSVRSAGIVHTPVYTGNINGNVTFVQMKNDLRTTTSAGFGSRLMANISLDKKLYRLQDRSEEGKLLGASFNHRFSQAVSFDLGFNERRQFNRAALAGGRLQDFILNDRSINATFLRQENISRSRFRWDGRMGGAVVGGEKTFKNDDTQWGSVNGGAAYTVGVMGSKITVRGRAAHKQTWETSTTKSGVDVFELESFQRTDVEPLGGGEDSLAASVNVRLNDSLYVQAEYTDYVGTRSYADQARGSLGSQQTGSDNLIWEKETRKSRAVNVVFQARPVQGFTLNVNSRHSVVGADYATQNTRFSETTTDEIGADINYASRLGPVFTSRMSRSEQFRDLGPQSVGSFDEVRKSFAIQGTQKLSRRTNLNVGYDTRISQSFYIDKSNPRDRDQLDNAVTARLTSVIWVDKVDVAVPFSWTTSDFVNIDRTQSSNNRRKSRYDFRPRINFKINPKFSISQEYWLSLEFTDFDFNETDNTLDRNVNFMNEFRYQLTTAISTKMIYRLELHDRGSYLPLVPGGERFLEKDREDRRDRMALGMQYRINANLSAVVDYDYSQKVDRTVSTGFEQVTSDGGIIGGIVGRYNWGPGRDLRLELKKANRFGSFNTEAQNDYWVMNSEIKYTF